MTTSALQHFLEHALEVRAPVLEHSFPSVFDWKRLVRDVPALVERATDGRFDALDSFAAHRVQDQADAVFRTAHTVALGVICAADDETADPEAVLDRFDEAPADEVEEAFEVLVTEVLGPAEAFLSDADVMLDERGLETQRLYALAWSHVSEYVARLGMLLGADGDPVPDDEAYGVLMALARVGALLACLRWMAEETPRS